MKTRSSLTSPIAAMVAILVVASFAVGADGVNAASPAAGRRPNILLIVADDLGYGELSCQGNPQIPTPNIDSIANNGIRFTSGYVSAPLCSPTRAGLMMGRYQQRFGHEFNPGGNDHGPEFGLPVTDKTIAERLKAAGYATGIFGKWHLGYAKPCLPTSRGFDWHFGFLDACHAYPFRNGQLGESLLPDTQKGQWNYTSEAFAEEAAAFIEQHREKPWFVYLPFGAVHCPPGKTLYAKISAMPESASKKYKDRFPNITDADRLIYAAVESAMDDAVGVVLAKLRELRLEENTLVFFLSDNGGPTWQTTSRNDPLRGQKGDLLEGGIREPFMVQWKGHLNAGKVDDRPIIQLDILPTALAAAGAPVSDAERLDGVNLLPYLAGENDGAPHTSLFWRYGKQRAVRMGDWKLVNQGKGTMLYNLANDIGEAKDLAAKEPAKVKELEAAYKRWNANNVPPRWAPKSKPTKGAISDADSSPKNCSKIAESSAKH